jgi:hypothetical protein
MKVLPIVAGLAVLAPSLALGHGGGLDKYGCHNDNVRGEYHCHQGKLKDRTYKSQDTMLRAHPDLRDGAAAARAENSERAKKEKAEDKLKDGDKTRTEEYAAEAKRKTATPAR